MTTLTVTPAAGALRGRVRVPGDKSVSHRAVIIGSLCRGQTEIDGFGPGADNASTISLFRQLGVDISRNGDKVVVAGGHLTPADAPLDCGNSGTTMRLVAGLLAGANVSAELIGDASLSKRPMRRVTEPLRQFGAKTRCAGSNGRPPIVVEPGQFRGGFYQSPVASAQVKSCLLLAAWASGVSMTVAEPSPSRDHTEVMLRYLGVPVESSAQYEDPGADGIPTVRLPAGHQHPNAKPIVVPGDISSAAFLLVAASIVPNSVVELTSCGWAATRRGITDVLRRTSADFQVTNERRLQGGEPACDLVVRSCQPTALELDEHEVPRLVDEIPVLAVLAGRAQGTSHFRGVAELRVKESDRLDKTVELMRAVGCDVQAGEDWFSVTGIGDRPFTPFSFDADEDHRMAAAAIVAAQVASAPCNIIGADALAVSYPHLTADLTSLAQHDGRP